MHTTLLLTLTLALTGAFTSNLNAQTSQEKGLSIAKEMIARDEGWGSSESNLIMTLRSRKGAETVREMRSKSFEVTDDGDKGLTIFDTPADVKGTAFLSHSHTTKNDDQWIYLPALKRVKRIASRNKSGPFLASEFAFEDLSSFEIEKFEFNYLRDENIDGMPAFVLEMKPTDKYSGYTRIQAWINQEHYRPEKLVFYDRRDTLLKTLRFEGYKLYKDKFWRADLQAMVNHKSGKSTDVELKNLEFGVDLTAEDFEHDRLKRAR